MVLQESLTFDHTSEESQSHDEEVTGKLTIVLLIVILVDSIDQELQAQRERERGREIVSILVVYNHAHAL